MMIGDQHRNAERARRLDALDAGDAVVHRDDQRRARASRPARRFPASSRSRSEIDSAPESPRAQNRSARSARTISALPVAPSASKSPITSTRPPARCAASKPRGRLDALERADRQQPLQRKIEILGGATTPRAAYTRRSTGCRSARRSRAADPAGAPADLSHRSSALPDAEAELPTTAALAAKIAALPRALTLKHRCPRTDRAAAAARRADRRSPARASAPRPRARRPCPASRAITDDTRARGAPDIASMRANAANSGSSARRPAVHRRAVRRSAAPRPTATVR